MTVYSPFQVPFLYNDKGVFSQVDVRQLDSDRFPLFQSARKLEVILEPGDAIFIPIAAWHMVESLDVSISLTFTDFNTIDQFHGVFPR